jgi:hypothetical protein
VPLDDDREPGGRPRSVRRNDVTRLNALLPPKAAEAVRLDVHDTIGTVTTASLQQEILALESRRIAAMTRQDLATLDAILADDLTYTHSGGHTDTKSSFLSLVGDPGTHGRYRSVEYAHAEVVPLGDAAIVRGRAQITLEGYGGAPDRSYPVLFLDVYERRSGEWRMVAWQATRARE